MSEKPKRNQSGRHIGTQTFIEAIGKDGLSHNWNIPKWHLEYGIPESSIDSRVRANKLDGFLSNQEIVQERVPRKRGIRTKSEGKNEPLLRTKKERLSRDFNGMMLVPR